MLLRCRHKLLNIKYTNYLEIKRFTSESVTNSEILVQHFGSSPPKVYSYIKFNKLERIKPENLIQLANLYKQLGFDTEKVLNLPVLLRLYPSTVDQYYTVLKEGGFRSVTPEVLAKFRTFCRRPIDFLKNHHLIEKDTDVVASFISHLSPRPENFHIEISDNTIWSEAHLKVLTEYLKWRLDATNDQIENLYRIHVTVHRKSFKYLCQNIALAEELGFTHEKILKYGYILHAYPKYTQEVIEKYANLCGVCIKKAMRMYPKLMTTPPSNVAKILKILKEHNISDEAISKRMNVFQLSPETVELRLQELERNADFKVLLHNPNILKLVVHHNRAKSRLLFLKELQLKCTTVSILGNDTTKFDIHIKEGRDTNTLSDIYAFLKGTFKKETSEFESTLKKHPYYLQVPLLQMEETYFYLRDERFNNSAISKVIYILLYPKEKIKNALKEVNSFASRRKKVLTQINKLNLVLYFIEKEHHFSGDGIWEKSDRLEEVT